MDPRNRIAIIGAGAVGSTIAYSLMHHGLSRSLVLVDKFREKAAAEVKDLMHGSPFVPAVELSTGDLEDCQGAAVVILTAGAKQKPGQTRLQLLDANVAIFREMISPILRAAPDAHLLVVSNPVDVLTYITLRLSELPRARVIGSGTVLDGARFRSLLAQRLNVAVGNVHAYVVGEHGDSEVPLWSSAQVGNLPVDVFAAAASTPLSAVDRESIFTNVRDAAAQVIAAKGATNWAIGLAVTRIVQAILRDEHAVLTVSSLLEDYHGISDVCISVPCLVARQGAGKALPLRFSDQELAALRRSAEIVRAAARGVGF